jgi:Rrf2 family transcriptional regulator, cysteine metabolism repressor
MKISFKTDYALKAILYMAHQYGSKLITGNELAQNIDAPVKFLEQVLLTLKKGGFIESKRGNVGGYYLSRPPEQMTVGEVLRFIEGPIEPISCVKEGYSRCKDIDTCVFKGIWEKVSVATSQIVDSVTFADLSAEVNVRKKAQEYII